jgi:hypothetical protein
VLPELYQPLPHEPHGLKELELLLLEPMVQLQQPRTRYLARACEPMLLQELLEPASLLPQPLLLKPMVPEELVQLLQLELLQLVIPTPQMLLDLSLLLAFSWKSFQSPFFRTPCLCSVEPVQSRGLHPGRARALLDGG